MEAHKQTCTTVDTKRMRQEHTRLRMSKCSSNGCSAAVPLSRKTAALHDPGPCCHAHYILHTTRSYLVRPDGRPSTFQQVLDEGHVRPSPRENVRASFGVELSLRNLIDTRCIGVRDADFLHQFWNAASANCAIDALCSVPAIAYSRCSAQDCCGGL